MKTHEFGSQGQSHGSVNNAITWATHNGASIKMILLVAVGSLVMGLMPILYGSTVAQNQDVSPTALGEAGVWNTLAERD
ncbi:MAG: hypothetical protein F6K21_18605 [Symploca sp. SIO2D2]|nr:hypothetical protein [Symploca sp. SIO2D2]NER19377.1 hypothetical protein [Symploca sp. SIO1C2]NER47994.1 hypothetical protein [Symploca sp. SIO1A3]